MHEPITTGPNVGKKVFNTSLWIEEGEVVRKYRKMHLFDVDSREGGEVKLTESMGTEAGTEIGEVFESGWGRVGMLVCFDVSCFLSTFSSSLVFTPLSSPHYCLYHHTYETS